MSGELNKKRPRHAFLSNKPVTKGCVKREACIFQNLKMHQVFIISKKGLSFEKTASFSDKIF